MVINQHILEQIINEEILVLNEYDVGAVITFKDMDGQFKGFFMEKRIVSNNGINAMRVLSEELDALHASVFPQEVTHVIIGISPYIAGVS